MSWSACASCLLGQRSMGVGGASWGMRGRDGRIVGRSGGMGGSRGLSWNSPFLPCPRSEVVD